MSDVATRAGVEINYKCRKGECGTCQVRIDGKWVKACQAAIAPSSLGSGSILRINTSSKASLGQEAEKKKPSKFFSPASFVEGVINNGLGVIGFLKEAKKVDSAYERRIQREKELQERVAARKQQQNSEK